MNTNATKTAKTAEANTIELGRVEIFEPKLESDRNVTLQFQIPAQIYLYGRRSLKEYEKIALEHIRIQSSVFFEIIEFLSVIINENESRNAETLLEYINTLSYFGKSFSEASEVVQMEFERYTKAKGISAKKESSENSPDNYDIDLLAVQLSEVLNNPNLPAKLYNIITDELCENHSDTTSPDYIKANLLNNSRLQDA